MEDAAIAAIVLFVIGDRSAWVRVYLEVDFSSRLRAFCVEGSIVYECGRLGLD